MTKRVWAGGAVGAAVLLAAVTWAAFSNWRAAPPQPAPPPDRFVDNHDGTVSDNQTGLMWEQQTGTVGAGVDCSTAPCSNPRDVNNLYQWNVGGAAGGVFTDFLPRLNGTLCSEAACTALGGHSDWRIPSVAELQTIVDVNEGSCGEGDGACLNPVFGPTVPGFYWARVQTANQDRSHTPGTDSSGGSWAVGFGAGDIGDGGAAEGPYTRAVRGSAGSGPPHDVK